MASTLEKRPARKTENNANETHHYITLVVAIAIGIVGTFFRFIDDSFTVATIANLLLALGWLIAFRVVFKIMK